jgi:hypothetical protein
MLYQLDRTAPRFDVGQGEPFHPQHLLDRPNRRAGCIVPQRNAEGEMLFSYLRKADEAGLRR